jgi:heptaprenyl diphosphate synthase/octaprenyl-diphosphate synthase
MAFQVVDDILDFEGVAEEVGKPVGSDLAQGTLTLPAIMLAERSPDDNPVRGLFQDEERSATLERALAMVRSSTIIPDAYAVAAEFCRKAADALAALPDLPNKRALLDITAYALERRK